MHAPSGCSLVQCLVKSMLHAREHPSSYALRKFSIYHASSTFVVPVPNTQSPLETLIVKSQKYSIDSLNEQHWRIAHWQTQTRCSVGLLLTSAGTSRLLPRCWLKERHQASVYPFILGTYFFTVSSLSLSHTPSSL